MPKRPLAGTFATPTMTPRLSFSSNSVPTFGLLSFGYSSSLMTMNPFSA